MERGIRMDNKFPNHKGMQGPAGYGTSITEFALSISNENHFVHGGIALRSVVVHQPERQHPRMYLGFNIIALKIKPMHRIQSSQPNMHLITKSYIYTIWAVGVLTGQNGYFFLPGRERRSRTNDHRHETGKNDHPDTYWQK